MQSFRQHCIILSKDFTYKCSQLIKLCWQMYVSFSLVAISPPAPSSKNGCTSGLLPVKFPKLCYVSRLATGQPRQFRETILRDDSERRFPGDSVKYSYIDPRPRYSELWCKKLDILLDCINSATSGFSG